ncbi:hypothetical protein KBB27_02095 [Patescibacteria group bacterium]|nr:hypothetical protein [Patescibacteria group bacterium]
MNRDLRTAVGHALEQGISRSELRETLARAGWTEKEREEALQTFVESSHPIAIPVRAPVTLAKESYLYFMQVLFYTLSAIAFLILWFQYINIWLPTDPTGYSDAYSSTRELIRTGLSMLSVSLPVFLLTSYFVTKHETGLVEAPQNALKQGFMYLGAIAASVTAAVTLMTTIYTGLNGEATSRFLLKVLAILLICGLTAFLASHELRSDRERREKHAHNPEKIS